MPTSPEEQIQAILERNRRVEEDKAWETSWTRRLSLLLVIYGTSVLFLWNIGAEPCWLQALVPAGGYLLSTLSLPWLRTHWLQRHRRTMH